MSETVHYTGKLTPVQLDNMNQSYLDKAKQILDERGIIMSGYHLKWGDAVTCLCDELYDEYIAIGGQLYSFTRKEHDPEEKIMNASMNEDGTIDYEVRYYNGGCGFREAIDLAMKNIINPNNNA